MGFYKRWGVRRSAPLNEFTVRVPIDGSDRPDCELFIGADKESIMIRVANHGGLTGECRWVPEPRITRLMKNPKLEDLFPPEFRLYLKRKQAAIPKKGKP